MKIAYKNDDICPICGKGRLRFVVEKYRAFAFTSCGWCEAYEVPLYRCDYCKEEFICGEDIESNKEGV